MEQQEKLSKFKSAVFSEIDCQAEELRKEAEEKIAREIQKNAAYQRKRSAEEVQKKVQNAAKSYRREIAKCSLEAKRDVLQTRMALTEHIFSAVSERLEEFRASEEYAPYLLAKIRAFSEACGLSHVTVVVDETDMPLAEEIKRAYSLPCQVEPGRVGGGFIIRGEGSLYDESLPQKLEEEKAHFIEHSELLLD